MATTEGIDVATDLVDEHQALDDVVAVLTSDGWTSTTPSPGWTVADQIGHLTYFDRTAHLAIVDPAAFAEHRRQLAAIFTDSEAVERVTLGEFRSMPHPELLAAWRTGRAELIGAARAAGNDVRVEWYGPSMSMRSFLTARLMETWAHGQDVVDGVGGARVATDRLRHVAQLGVITHAWTYRNRGLDVPEGDVRVVLTSPSGAEWSWGSEDSDDSVSGPAEDFCLVVTQRRHVDDTRLVTTGPQAREWMQYAQAFAGPATDGPAATRSGS